MTATAMVAPDRFVTIRLFATISGLTEKAIRRKMERGVWLEGRQWRREALADPNGFWGFDPIGPILDRVDAPRRARVDVWACPRFLTAADPPPGPR